MLFMPLTSPVPLGELTVATKELVPAGSVTCGKLTTAVAPALRLPVQF